MRKLFVSFTALLRALKEGLVTEGDLASGLFYFGCAREHALDPWKGETNEVHWYFKDNPEQGRVVHGQIVAAILLGESDGRVIWRTRDSRQSYEELNSLLVKHDVGSISCDDFRATNGPYCYPGVVDRVTEANLQLQVVH